MVTFDSRVVAAVVALEISKPSISPVPLALGRVSVCQSNVTFFTEFLPMALRKGVVCGEIL